MTTPAAQPPSTFACPACGKKYRWRAELVGRKAKCVCGQMITTPAAATSAPAPSAAPPSAQRESPAHDPMYDLVEDEPVRPKRGRPVEADAATSAPLAGLPPSALTPSFARAPRRDAATDAEANKAAVLKLLIPLGLIVLLVVGIVGYRFFASASKPPVPTLGEDTDIEEMIRDHDGTEALLWLKEGQTRMVMGMTRKQAEGRIQDFYNMGAVKVYAFDAQMSANLAIELPFDNPEGRKKLFAFEKQWHEAMMRKPAKDVGQKYLLLRMRV